jgi:sec-independent protein translocase protein TatB
MLDIGFSEILLIFALALVVLGPEKLPRVAAQVGRWIGRARGMARQFREQLEEEVNLEEARKTRPPAVTPPPAPPLPLDSTPEASTTPSTAPVSPPPLAAAEAAPQAEPEQQVYPDGYSHAHPTDSLGRTIEPPTNEPQAVDPGQQDWVGVPAGDGGVTATDKAAQSTPAAAYAPSHERGT